MKRLIVIIKIFLFSSFGFGHPSEGHLSNLHERPEYEFSYNTFLSPQIIVLIIDNQDTTSANQNCIITYQDFAKCLNVYAYFAYHNCYGHLVSASLPILPGLPLLYFRKDKSWQFPG